MTASQGRNKLDTLIMYNNLIQIFAAAKAVHLAFFKGNAVSWILNPKRKGWKNKEDYLP